MKHKYVIVGGGLAAASAIEGIRGRDPEGTILLLSRENHAPYHRPPLSKGLWFGKSTVDELAVHPTAFYREHGVELLLRREVVELDPEKHSVWDERGTEYGYERLLLATGGRPRRLNVPGADGEGLHYFRDLEDYLFFRAHGDRFEHALIIGAGFIGMEMAAALRHEGKEVTLLYNSEWPLARVLPRELGLFVADYYREKGVETVSNDTIVSFESLEGQIMARTGSGGVVTTQLVLAGVGIEPQTDLAEAAGLEVRDGIAVDEFCRTSNPDIYAAGDVAEYPDLGLAMARRVEHWDHAIQHGKCAGANMAGADTPYAGLPMFYSDLFDLGWEAVGEVDGSMETDAVWKEPFREGVVFYLREGVTRGVLLWNVWEKVEWARGLIREGKAMSGTERRALVEGGASTPASG
jgi:NADPH-dependent 2,4-dienoyl-CoA reductase/sulfur reductase-like enzyme